MAKSGSDGKSVSLVLGSGGARGLAHVGVIHWLEENNYRIKSISGCSMGAVVGGIYAAGRLDEYEKWARAIDRMDIVSLLDISWQRGGFLKGEKVFDSLRNLLGDRDIEDLPISYTAVAADIRSEKEVWIQSGSLFDAMRASVSLPMILTPFQYGDAVLIDGGVLNPVPIAPTFSDNTDLTIAVNLGGNHRSATRSAPKMPEATDEETTEIKAKIHHFIDRLQASISSDNDSEWGAFDVANLAFDLMQGTISRQKLAAYPPDKLVTIPRNACGMMEFDRAAEMIELGYQAATKQLADKPAKGS